MLFHFPASLETEDVCVVIKVKFAETNTGTVHTGDRAEISLSKQYLQLRKGYKVRKKTLFF